MYFLYMLVVLQFTQLSDWNSFVSQNSIIFMFIRPERQQIIRENATNIAKEIFSDI